MSLIEREREFEARYAHDQELRFRIEARRNKLLGLWAAEKLGLSGEDAGRYAQDLIRTHFESPGGSGAFLKVRKDFETAGVQQSDHQIERCMSEFLATAEQQIMKA